MIKIEHVVLPSPEQMDFAIEGMRNAMNSWKKSDSYTTYIENEETLNKASFEYFVGDNDLELMSCLAHSGSDHRKYMRMMPVMLRITAPLYWWKEFDTYKVGTVANSCSTMHKIHDKEFTWDDFSTEHLMDWDEDFNCDVLINKGITPDGYPCGISPIGALHVTIAMLNEARDLYLISRDKDIWWQMIQLLPSCYNQTRNVLLNYEVLSNIYRSRVTHKLDEWREFSRWIESLPYSDLIIRKARDN